MLRVPGQHACFARVGKTCRSKPQPRQSLPDLLPLRRRQRSDVERRSFHLAHDANDTIRLVARPLGKMVDGFDPTKALYCRRKSAT